MKVGYARVSTQDQRLQLRQTSQNSYAPRMHLQNLAVRTRKVYCRPDPSNARTKHLEHSAIRLMHSQSF